MGTHKICAAVNNGAPHQNARCDRTWAAVCGRSTTARVSAIGAAVKGNSEVRFWCRIKRCYHRLSHRPAERTWDAVGGEFQRFCITFCSISAAIIF